MISFNYYQRFLVSHNSWGSILAQFFLWFSTRQVSELLRWSRWWCSCSWISPSTLMQYPSTLLKQNTSAICSNKNHLDRKQCNLRERERKKGLSAKSAETRPPHSHHSNIKKGSFKKHEILVKLNLLWIDSQHMFIKISTQVFILVPITSLQNRL